MMLALQPVHGHIVQLTGCSDSKILDEDGVSTQIPCQAAAARREKGGACIFRAGGLPILLSFHASPV